ncbi:MAG TPA: response regulator transcription factor [Thermoanaerobaculia bacterium]|nr:response regulator transcription factor [Thermoanaerobaculia bacterium]
MEPFAPSPGRGGRVRVLLIGDDPLARSGLAALLAAEPGIAVVAQSTPGEDAAAAVAEHDPDVVLWDLGSRPENPLELPGTPAEEGAPLLALAPDDGPAAEALAAGARGVLYRDVSAGRLVAALEAVARGLVVLDADLAAPLLPAPSAGASSPAEPDEPVEPLTPREVEVLQLLAEGLSNKLIGSRLGISEHTAKFHVNAILGKLGAQGRTEAVVRAARLGLILL